MLSAALPLPDKDIAFVADTGCHAQMPFHAAVRLPPLTPEVIRSLLSLDYFLRLQDFG